MVDWSDKKLNHKFWVMMALLETLDTKDFTFCPTAYGMTSPPGSGIFAQGLLSSEGR